MQYDLDLELTLSPIWHDDPPQVIVRCHDLQSHLTLDQTRTVHMTFRSSGRHRLCIQFHNKQDKDSQPHLGLDKAVVIERISFFGISDPKFIWSGYYSPIYPEPWADQQRRKGLQLAPILQNVDVLGWNGTWVLEFDLPIFTWIHQVQNLGWIYR